VAEEEVKKTIIINFDRIADKIAKELGIKTTVRDNQKCFMGTEEQVEKFKKKLEEVITGVIEKETKRPEYIG
jgi:acylphosphatase